MSTVVVQIPTGSLYQIEDHLQSMLDTLDMIESPELRAEAEAEIARFLESEIRKVDSISNYLSLCESQQEAAKTEIKRLQERCASWAAREDRVRNYVQNVMERIGEKKLEGRTATFMLRPMPGSVVILNDNDIPEEFKKTTVSVSIDKRAIKKAMDEGRDVPGCDFSIGKSTLVRK